MQHIHPLVAQAVDGGAVEGQNCADGHLQHAFAAGRAPQVGAGQLDFDIAGLLGRGGGNRGCARFGVGQHLDVGGGDVARIGAGIGHHRHLVPAVDQVRRCLQHGHAAVKQQPHDDSACGIGSLAHAGTGHCCDRHIAQLGGVAWCRGNHRSRRDKAAGRLHGVGRPECFLCLGHRTEHRALDVAVVGAVKPRGQVGFDVIPQVAPHRLGTQNVCRPARRQTVDIIRRARPGAEHRVVHSGIAVLGRHVACIHHAGWGQHKQGQRKAQQSLQRFVPCVFSYHIAYPYPLPRMNAQNIPSAVYDKFITRSTNSL